MVPPQVLTVLLKHRCNATTTFVNEGGIELFRKMVRHLGNFSVMQVAKLLLLPKHAALQGASRGCFFEPAACDAGMICSSLLFKWKA